MHELAVAQRLVALVVEEADRASAHRVESVRLCLGAVCTARHRRRRAALGQLGGFLAMCAVCGCSHPLDGPLYEHGHEPERGHEHTHALADGSVVRHRHEVPSLARRTIEVERELLADNHAVAAANQRRFAAARTLVVNLMSSPGAGKTTLLEQTLLRRDKRGPVAVIEGDQQTSLDAERIRKTGTAAVQVNTGKACHLDAQMVQRALGQLPPLTDGLLLIENVGNLVCPAGFDLGEHRRVVIASVTEGEDKPLKYPEMFARAELIVVSKTDLLPYVDFDRERFIEFARRVRPGVEVLWLSARTGDGLGDWLAWLDRQRLALG
jgi:hydrogenase nickel incorporation protein HypB